MASHLPHPHMNAALPSGSPTSFPCVDSTGPPPNGPPQQNNTPEAPRLDTLPPQREESLHHNAEISRLANENQRLEDANEVLTRKLDQAQRMGMTLLQTGKAREASLIDLEKEVQRLKLQYEAPLRDELWADNTYCMICNKINPMRDIKMEIKIKINPMRNITLEGATLLDPVPLPDPGEWIRATEGNCLNNGNPRYWMCTPCFEESRPFTQ